MTQDHVLLEEQKNLERIYVAGEALTKRLASPVNAGNRAAAERVAAERWERREQILAVLADTTNLPALGRVDFDDGEHAGHTIYVGRVLIGDPDADYPPVCSWKAEISAAYFDPARFENGTSVALKRSLFGSDRQVHDYRDEWVLDGIPLLAGDDQSVSDEVVDEPVGPVEHELSTDDHEDQDGSVPTRQRLESSDAAPTPRRQPSSNTAPARSPSRPSSAKPFPKPTHKDLRPTKSRRPQGQPVVNNLVDPLIARLRDRSGGQLGDIVATIQARQYELMERPIDRNLVIQGGPGTGKTVIALHRVALQLYRERTRLKEQDVLFVGPSQTFIRYVDQVLPQLGNTQVLHRSIHDLGRHETEPTTHDPVDVSGVKGLPVMVEVISRYLLSRARVAAQAVRLGPSIELEHEQLEPILELARNRAGVYRNLRRELRTLLSDAQWLRPLVQQRRATLDEDAPSKLRLDPEAVEAFVQDTVPTISARQAIYGLLTSPDLLEIAADGLLTASQQALIRRRPNGVEQHVWTFEDLPLLDEAAHQLRGTGTEQRYAHVVVDEAQDFSPMQLRVLNRRTTGHMTILGDLAQASSGWAPATWEDHLQAGGLEPGDIEALEVSYRTTAPILDLANRLLLVIDLDVAPPRSVLLDGDEPHIELLGMHARDDQIIADRITKLRARRPAGNVGIIAPVDVLEKLRIDLAIRGFSVAHAADDLNAPVVLLRAEQTKGLEFDDVIIVEPETLHRSDPVAGPRSLYVAMTRARSTLTLLPRGRLPAALTGLGLTAPIKQPEPAQVAENLTIELTLDAVDDEVGAAGSDEAPALPASEPLLRPEQRPAKRRARSPGGPNVPMDGPDVAAPPHAVASARPVHGLAVLFTDHAGVERRQLVEHAQALGVRVEPTLSDQTDVVVAGDITVQSRRARKARELAIPFASVTAFLAATRDGDLEIMTFRPQEPPTAEH